MKPNLSKIILIVWSVISLVYIIFITWTDFKTKEMAQAYQTGESDTVSQIIKQAQSEDCQSFTVYNSSGKVQLVNAQCLPQQQNQTQGQTSVPNIPAVKK